MEKRVSSKVEGWPVSEFAPVLMRAPLGADLLRKESWTYASDLSFNEAVQASELDAFGVPFYPAEPHAMVDVGQGRTCAPIGWLETNVVQFTDPNHIWYDDTGHTFHLWMRAHTGGTGYAAIVKVVEQADGSMHTQVERVPSGKRIIYVPCPGGQMKFHMIYDEVTRLFWLLSSQSTDSMCRADRLPADRYNLPNNERHRLQLHFSRNCIDWCFSGLVDAGKTPIESRHYASMAIDRADLLIVSRSGDEMSVNAHDVNLTTFHRISKFRDLVY